MARPIKQGLDYFPLDTNIDSKLELFKAEHGIQGFGFIIILFQKIYSNNYYIEWNNDEQLLFSDRNNVDINLINEYINSAIKREIFNKAIYEKYGVLTSRGIQKRFLEICKRRKQIEIQKEYFLINIDNKEYEEIISKIVFVNNNLVNVNNNEQNVTTTLVNVDNSTQRKEKESKGKESKQKQEAKIQEEFSVDVVVDFYNNNIGSITNYSMELLNSYREDGFSDELLIYAMEIAVEQNKRTLAYIKAILNTWSDKKISSVLEAKQESENFKGNTKKDNPQKAWKSPNQTDYPPGYFDQFYANKKK